MSQMHARMRTVSRNMRLLVRICGSYLWPASLPKEPAVRFIHMGSGVFCTSVLTSGSISEGDGVSFAPAMALRVRGCLLPAQPGSSLFPSS